MSGAKLEKQHMLEELELEASEVSQSVDIDAVPRAPAMGRLGRYRLVRELASGGMATVNLAVVEGLDKLVAIKVIHPHLAKEDSFVGMFLDEARIASSISHRNVCSVFDFGECDGHFYLAMEYLAGQCLRDVNLRRKNALLSLDPVKHSAYAAYIIAEACEGLHAAHELKGPDDEPLRVVHRDVSPHNLFVTYDGNVSVVDFGIAHAQNRIQHTATGIIKGKFSYMAPEQVRQLEIDRRADVWALGVCLWESLTLKRLFLRGSQADTLMSVLVEPIRAPSEVRSELPRELDRIVMRALSRDLAVRYPNARELGRDLMEFCRASGMAVGGPEIEQWMAQLFSEEITRKKYLVRSALSTPSLAVSLDSVSGLSPRAPTHSGAMLKGWRTGTHPSAVSVANSVPHLASAAPAEARPTAGPVARGRAWLGMCVVGAGLGILGSLAMQTAWMRSSDPDADVAVHAERGPVDDDAPSAPPAPQTVAAVQAVQPPPPASAIGAVSTATPERPAPAPVRPVRPQRPRPREVMPAREPEALPAPTPSPQEMVAPVGVPEAAPAAAPAPASSHAPVVASAPVASASPAPRLAPPPVAPRPRVVSQRAEPKVSELDVEGSLGDGVVTRMLMRSLPLLRTCYAEAAQRAGNGDLSMLTVSLSIDETGSVRDVRTGTHPLPGFGSCATATLRRLRSDIKPDIGKVRVRFQVQLVPL